MVLAQNFRCEDLKRPDPEGFGLPVVDLSTEQGL